MNQELEATSNFYTAGKIGNQEVSSSREDEIGSLPA